MIQWWYSETGKALGPTDVDGLAQLFKTGTVSPRTRVWHEGMAAWSPIAALPELKGIVMPLPAFPQNVPPPPPLTTPRSIPAYASPVMPRARSSAGSGTGTGFAKLMILLIAIILIGSVGYYFVSSLMRNFRTAAEHNATSNPQNMARTDSPTMEPATHYRTEPVSTPTVGAGSKRWENPVTHRFINIDPSWQIRVTQTGNCQFDNESLPASIVLTMNDRINIPSTQSFQESVASYKQSLAAQGIRFTDQGNFTFINGHDAWEAGIEIPGKVNVNTRLQILVLGNRLWQVITLNSGNEENTDSRLERLRQQLWSTVL